MAGTNGVTLLGKPESGVDLQQQAMLRGIVCPTCRRDGTQTPLFAVGVGPGVQILFCVHCLLPKLSELTPPMMVRDKLPEVPDGRAD